MAKFLIIMNFKCQLFAVPLIFSNLINGFSGVALQEAYYIAMFYVFNTAIAIGAFVCFD